MIHKRIFSSICLAIMVTLIVIYSTSFPLIPLLVFGFLVAIGTMEFYSMVQEKGIKIFKIYGAIASVGLFSVAFVDRFFPGLGNLEIEGVVIFFIICVLFLLQAGKISVTSSLFNIFITFGGVFYVGWLASFIVKINFFEMLDGRLCLLYLILVTKITDVGAYVVGKLIGKHKLAQTISPNKTIEGTVGGILSAMFVSAYPGIFILPISVSVSHLLMLGLIVGIVSQLGDLAESMLKRDAQVKDSGDYIPGMGGVLDFLDSVLFTAPFVYFYFTIVLHIR